MSDMGNKRSRIYAFYIGEKNICDGTLEEISKKTGMTMDYLKWMTRPSAVKRLMGCKKVPKCLVFIGEEELCLN